MKAAAASAPNPAHSIRLAPERFSTAVTRWTGGTSAFRVALAVIVVSGVTGPLFAVSHTWQLVINTGTTIVTFLMVFLIQRAQNKDSRAIHLKRNELVAAVKGAGNRLIGNCPDHTRSSKPGSGIRPRVVDLTTSV